MDQKQFEAPLGQLVCGNPWGALDFGGLLDYVSGELYVLSEMLGRKNPDDQAHGCLGGEWGYGQDFKSDVFEMHPYWWGDENAPEAYRPNFKCGDLEVRWYKYIGRGMSVNRAVTRRELESIFRHCRQSIA